MIPNEVCVFVANDNILKATVTILMEETLVYNFLSFTEHESDLVFTACINNMTFIKHSNEKLTRHPVIGNRPVQRGMVKESCPAIYVIFQRFTTLCKSSDISGVLRK